MNKNILFTALAVSAFWLLVGAAAVLSGPRSYEDCMLQAIAEAPDDVRFLNAIVAQCRAKFPEDFSGWTNPFEE